MTDSLWACPDCGRTSSQPSNVTAVTCMNFTGHKGNTVCEMEEVEEE